MATEGTDDRLINLRLDDPTAFGDQCLELFVRPGLDKRIAAGEALPPAEAWEAIQVPFRPDGGFDVRVNAEVKLRVTAVTDAADEVSDSPRLEDLNVVATEMLGVDEPCAHITLVKFEDGWHCYANLRYHQGFAQQHQEAATEFLDTAVDALEVGRRRAFVENLFAAAELLARAYIYVQAEHPKIELKGRRTKRKHDRIEKTLDQLSRDNRVAPPSPKVLKRLGELRRPARYLDKEFTLDDKEATALFDDVRAMRAKLLEFLEAGLPIREAS